MKTLNNLKKINAVNEKTREYDVGYLTDILEFATIKKRDWEESDNDSDKRLRNKHYIIIDGILYEPACDLVITEEESISVENRYQAIIDHPLWEGTKDINFLILNEGIEDLESNLEELGLA